MSVRVHELAKELKISTGALQKHLKDLGITVKSHMSHLEEESAQKVRNLFQQERDSNKKREEERKRYLAAKQKEKEQEIAAQLKKAHEKKKAEETAKEAQAAKKAQEEAKSKTPTFIEKPLDKKKTAEETEPQKAPDKPAAEPEIITEEPSEQVVAVQPEPEDKAPDKKADTETTDTEKPTHPQKPKKVILTTEPKLPETPSVAVDEKEAAAKKRTPITPKKDEPDTKLKHIQAKLKHGKKGKKKKGAEPIVEESEVKRNIKQTMSKQRKKKYKKEEKFLGEEENVEHKITISELTSINELAKIMDIPATEIIMKFFKMGKTTTINQRLDRESLEMICDEFDFDVSFEQEYGAEIFDVATEKHKDAADYPRPPIVTIMGHVDHGKTSILDYLRSSNVAAGESGGITQHIGAYQITHNGSKITFLDTPGHEAFTAMRARGAHITDIAILVVAADDSVKPQTVEAMDHARASGVEIIVAINKIDLKTANVDRVIADLSKQKLYLENYGGHTLWATCSAITGQGIDDLLEAILLVTEMKELKAKRDVPGAGVVIEAKKDSRIGPIATILLREGTLKKSDAIVCGATSGKIRKMEDAKGNTLNILYPSDVALIYGLDYVPKEGDILNQVDSERVARQISFERKTTRQDRERLVTRTNLDNLFMKIKQKEMADIKLIVKADTDGSVDAFCDAVEKLSNDEVSVNVIHKGVGSIVEADVNLAAASDALIIGFHVRAETKAKKLAEENNIQIKTYQIIYEGIAEIKLALEGMIEPEYEDRFVGSAIVRQLFKVKGVGVIAGCAVDKGKIIRNGIVRLFRNTGLIHQGKLSSLKHFAADVEEVRAGSECGMAIHNFNDIKEGDVIEIYIKEEIPRKL